MRVSRLIVELPAMGTLQRHKSESLLLAAQMASFLATLLVARIAGPVIRGDVTVLITWSAMTGLIVSLSIDKSIVLRLRQAFEERLATEAIYRGGLFVASFLAGAAMIVGGFLGYALRDSIVFALCVGIGSGATIAFEIPQAWSAAHKRVDRVFALRLGAQVLFLGSVLGVWLSGLGRAYAPAYLLGLVASQGLSVWAGFWFTRSPHRPMRRECRGFVRVALKAHLGLVAWTVLARLHLYLGSVFLTPKTFGVFAVAGSFGQAVAVMGAVGTVRGLAGVETRGSGIVRAAVIGGVVTLLILVPELLRVMYGARYATMGAEARVLLVAGVVSGLVQASLGRMLGKREFARLLVTCGVGYVSFGAVAAWNPTSALLLAWAALTSAVCCLVCESLLDHWRARSSRLLA